jgi:hypothetical protein
MMSAGSVYSADLSLKTVISVQREGLWALPRPKKEEVTYNERSI